MLRSGRPRGPWGLVWRGQRSVKLMLVYVTLLSHGAHFVFYNFNWVMFFTARAICNVHNTVYALTFTRRYSVSKSLNPKPLCTSLLYILWLKHSSSNQRCTLHGQLTPKTATTTSIYRSFSRWIWVSWFPFSFLLLLVLEENLWGLMAHGFYDLPTQQTQCTEGNTEHWPQTLQDLASSFITTGLQVGTGDAPFQRQYQLSHTKDDIVNTMHVYQNNCEKKKLVSQVFVLSFYDVALWAILLHFVVESLLPPTKIHEFFCEYRKSSNVTNRLSCLS